MSMRYPGGLINGSPVNAQYPSGAWTLSQTNVYNSQNVWQYDQYWRNTTLLLHGDGTNGAQNNTFLDSSSNNFSITRNGNTTQGSFTPYQQDGYWSGYFDGTTGLNDTGAGLIGTSTSTFTVEAWVNLSAAPTGSAQHGSLVGLDANFTTTTNYMSFGPDTGQKLRLFWYSGSDNSCYGSTTLAIGVWYHIALVVNSNAITMYVNGVQETLTGTTTLTNRAGTSGQFNIGKNGQSQFKGYASNVRISNSARTITVPTAPYTSDANTLVLACNQNRFASPAQGTSAITWETISSSVQAFQPFPGATTWSASVLGGSGYFDGSGDYCTFSSNTSMDFGTGNFTIEGWFYTGDKSVSGGASRTLIGNSGNSYTMQVYLSTAGYMTFGNTGSTYLQGATDLANNAWHHFAISRTGTGTNQIGMWVDGVRVAQGTNSQNYTSGTIYLGSFSTTDGFWNGYISNLRIVKGSAVYDPANSSITVPTSPLTAITNTSLLLNFTNAGIFDNAQMNNLETVGNAQVSTSVVKYGTGSIYLDGSGDWLAGPPTPQTDLGSGDFTIEAWLYRTASGAGSDSGIVSRGAPSTLNGFVFGYTSGNVLVFNFNYSGAIVTGVTVIPANTWTHVAVSRNGNTFRLFVNGVLDATATSTNSQTTNAGDIFYIGRAGYDSGRIVTGYLDDVRLTKGVARYVTSFTPPIARMPNQ